MNAGWLVLLLAATAIAGCSAGQQANPNLAAPKLVVAARPDGNATIFVHSAFGERAYDWIDIKLDNGTLVNRSRAFSVEESVAPGFFLNASAQEGEAMYVLRARVDVFPTTDRASVTFLDAKGKWSSDAESFGLPFERLLERRGSP